MPFSSTTQKHSLDTHSVACTPSCTDSDCWNLPRAYCDGPVNALLAYDRLWELTESFQIGWTPEVGSYRGWLLSHSCFKCLSVKSLHSLIPSSRRLWVNLMKLYPWPRLGSEHTKLLAIFNTFQEWREPCICSFINSRARLCTIVNQSYKELCHK